VISDPDTPIYLRIHSKNGQARAEEQYQPPSIAAPRGDSMQSRADQFRKNADDCERRAASCKDRHAKKVFEELAHQWRYLARQIEEMDLAVFFSGRRT